MCVCSFDDAEEANTLSLKRRWLAENAPKSPAFTCPSLASSLLLAVVHVVRVVGVFQGRLTARPVAARIIGQEVGVVLVVKEAMASRRGGGYEWDLQAQDEWDHTARRRSRCLVRGVSCECA